MASKVCVEFMILTILLQDAIYRRNLEKTYAPGMPNHRRSKCAPSLYVQSTVRSIHSFSHAGRNYTRNPGVFTSTIVHPLFQSVRVEVPEGSSTVAATTRKASESFAYHHLLALPSYSIISYLTWSHRCRCCTSHCSCRTIVEVGCYGRPCRPILPVS